MLFNSIEFALFLPVVFLLYWFVFNGSIKWQNLLIVTASYVFYGWWDWRFLSLIAISSLIDYFVGIGLQHTAKPVQRRALLMTSILLNLGLLGFFKYFNFFIESFSEAFRFFGHPLSVGQLHIVLPVGISFYTFQTMSYSIDVYRKKLEPTKDLISFMAYVSFFPQLVAGPIERATHLLPQFYKVRTFDYSKAVDGMRQILWGLFKKIVIADNCATYASQIFDNYTEYSGSTLFLGAFFFAFQIYGDFSGYSDIAIGTSRLFGFSLMRNFAFPYFSRDIAEFWRRWHISLSTWFRDYVYIPLGGSHGTRRRVLLNTIIVFTISGFWHGANWTFVAWGFLNALYFIPLLLTHRNRVHTDTVAEGRILPTPAEFLQMCFTFLLSIMAWVFFRSRDLDSAFQYIRLMCSKSFFSMPQIHPMGTLVPLFVFILIEWLQREKQHALELSNLQLPRLLRWGIYYGIIVCLAILGGSQQEFIYFQF